MSSSQSPVSINATISREESVVPSLATSRVQDGRDPRFLLYWATLTSTTTATTYSTTITLASILCTPTGHNIYNIYIYIYNITKQCQKYNIFSGFALSAC